MSKFSTTTDWYTVALSEANPNTLYVFGGNLIGFGCGGQAY